MLKCVTLCLRLNKVQADRCLDLIRVFNFSLSVNAMDFVIWQDCVELYVYEADYTRLLLV